MLNLIKQKYESTVLLY